MEYIFVYGIVETFFFQEKHFVSDTFRYIMKKDALGTAPGLTNPVEELNDINTVYNEMNYQKVN